jgi:lysophospholipase L1-like esterase
VVTPLPSAPSTYRYVAIGDSSTEGMEDRAPGGALRGWSYRLAQRLHETHGGLLYANLAVRGKRTREVRDEQLAPALAMQPDLLSVFAGTNDLLAPRFDARAVAADLEAMFAAGIAQGACVLTFTLPDLAPVMPLARALTPRVQALAHEVRAAAARTGAIVVDFAPYPVTVDARLWAADRIHANAAGHARIAAALAHALALPGSDATWQLPLAPMRAPSRGERMAAEWAWMCEHLASWIAVGLRGQRTGDGRVARRPELMPWSTDDHGGM